MNDREIVGNLLMELVRRAQWGENDQTWAYTSHRLQIWDDCPAQPACYVQEGDERHTQTTNMMPIRIWEYRLVIYQDVGKDSTHPRPSSENSRIITAIESLIPAQTPDERQTLGDRVHSVSIKGTIMKDSGDLDGQAMIVIPIEVIVP